MLSLALILLSLFTALLIGLLPETKTYLARKIALSVLFFEGLIGAFLLYDSFKNPLQYIGIDNVEKFAHVIKYEWFSFTMTGKGTINLNLFLGLDGINTPLVVISLVVLWIGAFVSVKLKTREKSYYSLFMVLAATVVGAFSALDFVLFFVFFEFMLVPMYLLIGIWGGERKEYAAVKFFIYTFIGSLFILISMIYLGINCIDPIATAQSLGLNGLDLAEAKSVVQDKILHGFSAAEMTKIVYSFSLADMADPRNFLPSSDVSFLNPHGLRALIFWCVMIGFGIKLPIVPLHTWLPDAHTEASTPISVVLAGILLKFGGYGLIRIGAVIFPDMMQEYAYSIAVWGAFSLIYGGIMALGQTHLKKLIAYASIAHMGFVVVGLASMTVEGLGGAIYQMFAHAILSPLLFIIAGILSERTNHHLEIPSFGGLHQIMPRYSSFAALAFLAAMGMPFFCGFIGEFFVLMGTMRSSLGFSFVLALLVGMLIGVSYSIYTYRRMFLGQEHLRIDIPREGLYDLTLHERISLISLVLLAFIFGIYPRLLWEVMQVSLSRMGELSLLFKL